MFALRELGEPIGEPEIGIHNCEVGNLRVDVAKFSAFLTPCGAETEVAFARFLDARPRSPGEGARKTGS
jgi:hypothetical protein